MSALPDVQQARQSIADCTDRLAEDSYLSRTSLADRILPRVRFQQFSRTLEFQTGGWKGRRLSAWDTVPTPTGGPIDLIPFFDARVPPTTSVVDLPVFAKNLSSGSPERARSDRRQLRARPGVPVAIPAKPSPTVTVTGADAVALATGWDRRAGALGLAPPCLLSSGGTFDFLGLRFVPPIVKTVPVAQHIFSCHPGPRKPRRGRSKFIPFQRAVQKALVAIYVRWRRLKKSRLRLQQSLDQSRLVVNRLLRDNV
jgi:hypothetical protein